MKQSKLLKTRREIINTGRGKNNRNEVKGNMMKMDDKQNDELVRGQEFIVRRRISPD